jgi:hypothetical protein
MDKPGEPESLAEVLASIRALVSAETESRSGDGGESTVLVLTPEMRVRSGSTEGLAAGMESPGEGGAAPILDEESLRAVINALVREELQGELGERINRNLRKLVRQEISQFLEEQRKD